MTIAGIWLYEELSNDEVTEYKRVKEAINVLLVSLKFTDRTIAMFAVQQLHLLTHVCGKLMKNMPQIPPRIIDVSFSYRTFMTY